MADEAHSGGAIDDEDATEVSDSGAAAGEAPETPVGAVAAGAGGAASPASWPVMGLAGAPILLALLGGTIAFCTR
ncbi:hypothetical protein BH23ACT9_BH23ACT9_30670 [soil metagenome]